MDAGRTVRSVILPSISTEAPISIVRNPELEEAARRKATQLYKQMMNDRAVLFNMTKVEGWEDINSPDLMEKRRQLALKICSDNYDVNEAYDDLAHVKEHGTLPDSGEEEELQQGEIPDLELKPAIDNLRKALGKLRKKEQTPERVAMIQRNEAKLEALLRRWTTPPGDIREGQANAFPSQSYPCQEQASRGVRLLFYCQHSGALSLKQ